MGNPLPGADGNTLASQSSFVYTSTKSVFSLSAGPVDINCTFLSPVYPTDLKRQSVIFSYLEVEVASNDGDAHDVQLYTDISAGKR
jgi:2-succinyl-5-enolpyruvyl-6-hydroxy-3-cyclohexene-1-carboxylate synthase